MVFVAEAKELGRRRRYLGIVQKPLADSVGISTATLSLTERGFISERASLTTLVDIGNAVGVDVIPILKALAPLVKRDFGDLLLEVTPALNATRRVNDSQISATA